MRSITIRQITFVALLSVSSFLTQATVLRGKVYDRDNHEPLVGAIIEVKEKNISVVADIDGSYTILLKPGSYTVASRYLGYRPFSVHDFKISGDTLCFDFALDPDKQILSEVTVTAIARRDSEIAQIQEQKNSAVVQNGVSAQEISKTQDKDASEVIKRIPGISIIDEKFVMVRGLSQRYNNVWLNGSAVPSSDADSRAFSFDIIPSSQLDNMVIVKSPAPEYPADFTGGFVLVNTKRQSHQRSFDISAGVGINDNTHFKKFIKANGALSALKGGFDVVLPTYSGHDTKIDPIAGGFDNDWSVRTVHPIADTKFNACYSQSWKTMDNATFGILGTFNYSRGYNTLLNMENSLYGPFDITNNKEVPLRKATDNQYTISTRIGAMLNLSFQPKDNRHYFEWKNMFNQTIKQRYSERVGFNAQSDRINDMEYYYSKRPTVNTQFTGYHAFGHNFLDWSTGYAFAQRNLPDRRLIQRSDRTEQTMGIYRISREFTKLDEHTVSLAVNYRHEFNFGAIHPTFKSGGYGEYRSRTYRTRQFQYGWNPVNTLPEGFMFDSDVQENVLSERNYGHDKLYMYEEVNFLNNYNARQQMAAAYLSVNIPWRRFDIYAGVRYEYCRQRLEMNTRQYEESLHGTDYDYSDLFPSINATYRLCETHQFRVAYGRSVNRPEFRELSSSVFYDFDLSSSVMGNPDLKAAYIDNLDFRWEWYPSKGEQISVALFYKHFSNPIEWTYTVAGGTDLIYSFINAKGARNYGIEIELRKNLGFIGLKDFSLAFNGALIKSNVQFEKGSANIDRPMQGQSPYLVNTGLFYANSQYGWSAAILYNCIGKRIIGVGNRYGTLSDGTARNIPNSYEMPRHSLDLSVSKNIGKFNIKFAVRDILASRYLFKQMEEVVENGSNRTVEEVTRSYKPGLNFNLIIGYNF